MTLPNKPKRRANAALQTVLRGMTNRCYYSNEPSHIRNYQEKGIKICDEWRKDTLAFEDWAIDNGWKPGLTIDRISSGGNYCPGNCRFVTMAINARNSSATKLTQGQVDDMRAAHAKGEVTAKVLSDRYGVTASHVRDIIKGKYWKP